MMDEHQDSNQQDICDLSDEKTSITGGKSVSEIVQLLRTTKLKIPKGLLYGNEDADDLPSKSNQAFPWMGKFTVMCKQVILKPNIQKLDELITQFLKNIEEDVKQCYKKPKRAYKLRLRMNTFLMFFHMIYWEIKKPLEHTSYLDKMSDILAHYIDVEMKSSRRGREHPKKISERICTSLFLFLEIGGCLAQNWNDFNGIDSMPIRVQIINGIDFKGIDSLPRIGGFNFYNLESLKYKCPDHILNTVLKAKFFVKKYSDICVPVMARLLKDNPGQMYENTYVRYLLSFKLWKKLAGKDHYVSINKEAVAKLKPPPDFAEKLKTGLFSNVLPYVSKSEKDRLTLFFMQSPFNVKKKAQLFLKDGRRIQPTGDLEKAFLFEEDFNLNHLFDDDSLDNENNPDLMNEIWSSIMENEPETVCIDDLFNVENLNEEEKIIIDLSNTNSKEKTKKVSKEKTNGVLKGSLKIKRKSVKFNSCVTVKNVLNKESSELIKTEKSKSLIPVTSKEDISFPSVIKVEENLKKEEKPCLISSHSADLHKTQKPCATVEPEQCKEVEPDSQSKSTDAVLCRSPQKPSFNNLETVNRTKDNQFKTNSENSGTPMNTDTDYNISSAVNIVPSEIVDSSGICDEVKVETNSEEVFVVSNVYKDIPMVDQLVAEEVVIGTEMSQDDVCTEFIVMDENVQGKLDQNDIMSVISVPKDQAIFCTDSVIINSGAWKKSQDKQEVQTEMVSVLENQNSTNGANQIKRNYTKEQSSVSPENIILSSIVASSESSDNYVSFDRRHDSYIYNDIFLTRFFSEVNADDGSDDDNRCNDRSRYAGGGKIPAFREQSEESKSDGGEEFESPSPASRSDSQRSIVEVSPDSQLAQPTHTDQNSQDYDQADHKSGTALVPYKEESRMVPEQNSTSPPLREVSVSLPYISGLGNRNDYLVNKEKISPKGMSDPSLNRLHIKTVADDYEFSLFQDKLFAFYNTTQNILDTDPTPFPPTVVNGHNRCPCTYCEHSLASLQDTSQVLHTFRCSKICIAVDKKRAEQMKIENDKLLKSIEETIPKIENSCVSEPARPDQVVLVSEPESNNILMDPKDVQMGTSFTNSDIKKESQLEQKSEYSSLPPKKRKAFNMQREVPEFETSRYEITNTKRVKGDGKNITHHSVGDSCEISSATSVTKCTTELLVGLKECHVVIDKFSPVKIKSVDGYYRVLADDPRPERKDSSRRNCKEILPESCSKSKHKCKKSQSREEKRLRKKERKRLKKLRKQEELMDESQKDNDKV